MQMRCNDNHGNIGNSKMSRRQTSRRSRRHRIISHFPPSLMRDASQEGDGVNRNHIDCLTDAINVLQEGRRSMSSFLQDGDQTHSSGGSGDGSIRDSLHQRVSIQQQQQQQRHQHQHIHHQQQQQQQQQKPLYQQLRYHFRRHSWPIYEATHTANATKNTHSSACVASTSFDGTNLHQSLQSRIRHSRGRK